MKETNQRREKKERGKMNIRLLGGFELLLLNQFLGHQKLDRGDGSTVFGGIGGKLIARPTQKTQNVL